ncbi:MAG: hypothetical protein K0A89_02730 [ANME-2 cluster archaeon]|nr:hypothetical protein [ANME-2 cluster archaeon]
MIRNRNQDVDEVSTGFVLVIIALLLLLFSPVLLDFFSIPREITGYEDKNTRLPTSLSQQTIFGIGILLAITGFALFFKHFVNIVNEGFSQRMKTTFHH